MKRFLLTAIGIILFVGLLGRAVLFFHGLTVTSWWRTPWKNAAIEGKPLSLHLIGWAYDVIPVNAAMSAALRQYNFKVVVESDHLHLQIV